MTEEDLYVWVFGMDLPSIPNFAWDVIKNAIDPGVDLSRAKDTVSPATRELGRFLNSMTLYSIWIERLRRLEVAPGSTQSKSKDTILTSGNAVSTSNIPTGHGRRRTPVCTSTVGAC